MTLSSRLEDHFIGFLEGDLGHLEEFLASCAFTSGSPYLFQVIRADTATVIGNCVIDSIDVPLITWGELITLPELPEEIECAPGSVAVPLGCLYVIVPPEE